MDVVDRKPGVRWGMVILGLLLAWITGIFVGLFAAAGSAEFFAGKMLQAGVVVTVVVALVYFAIYWFMRRPAPDLALGILIGGCMVALGAGACGALMSGMTYAG
jgi:hypothetical protein